MTEKTPEQLAAEKLAADQKKAEEKAASAKKREEAKAAKAKAREDAKAAKLKEKEDAKAAKVKEKADALAAKEQTRMPEQNGVRRPKVDTLCGKAWTIFDEVSAAAGSPAAIGPSLEKAKAQALNEANVRAEYARWRKFHGISGRTSEAAAEPAAATAGTPTT